MSRYCFLLKRDPESIWLDFCRGYEEPKAFVRAFLRDYVESSVRKVPTLGPEEVQMERTVNSASSVTDRWRRLTAYVDGTIMMEMRRCDRENPQFWRLTCDTYARNGRNGPVPEISQASKSPVHYH